MEALDTTKCSGGSISSGSGSGSSGDGSSIFIYLIKNAKGHMATNML